MQIPTHVETLVVGAGHAGLVMGWFLGQAGRDHLIVDRRSSPGGSWSDLWDSFRLVTPNWTASFPDAQYDGGSPDGFMPRDEIHARVAGYAAIVGSPIAAGTDVRRLAARDDGGFRLETDQGIVTADQVIAAGGSYGMANVPAPSAGLPADVLQLHAQAYREPSSLPPGAVLIVGSGQTGAQLAEELMQAGRQVYLSVGRSGRVPRRYRGRDIFRWLAAMALHGDEVGVRLPSAEQLPDPAMRLAGSPQLSGQDGGHDVDLHQLSLDGLTLLGRIEGADGHRIGLADDLVRNVAGADQAFERGIRPLIDTFVERAGIDAPPDERDPAGRVESGPTEVDLHASGISVVLWATGYRPDLGWIDLPILDAQGYPRHRRGVSEVAGLYFLGLHWQHTLASATLFGPTLDGAYLAEHMGLQVSPDALTPSRVAARLV